MVTSITLRFPALARLCGGFSTLSRNSFHAICMQRARLLFLILRFFIASRKTPDTSKCPLWLVAAFSVSGPGNLPTLDTRILHRMPVSSFLVSSVLHEGRGRFSSPCRRGEISHTGVYLFSARCCAVACTATIYTERRLCGQ